MDLLEINDLKVSFKSRKTKNMAVRGVSLSVKSGEVLGIVGESGCGKSVTALSIMGLVPSPPSTLEGGSINFEGRDLARMSDREMEKVRGRDISMIFQEPMTSLNPVLSIGFQMRESFRLHEKDLSKAEQNERALEMLKLVGITAPQRCMKAYPHQLSGGQRQRVMIAMALACRPKLLIADEPTTALDVTIQAQVLELMRGLQKELGTAILFITHDLGVIAGMCDRVAVMYAGRVVEEAPVGELFKNPRHPYTRGLMDSIPRIDRKSGELYSIPGNVPKLSDNISGCRFNPRCPLATDECRNSEPELREICPGHMCRCIHKEEA